MVYTLTYEGTRHFLIENNLASNNAVRASVGGGLASATCLLLVVPSDIVSQHMMVFERKRSPMANLSGAASAIEHGSVDFLNLRQLLQREPGARLFSLITREIYRRDGLIGFYRGYPASLLCYAPSSAALWALYIEFSSKSIFGHKSDFLTVWFFRRIFSPFAQLVARHVASVRSALRRRRRRRPFQRLGFIQSEFAGELFLIWMQFLRLSF